MTRQSLSQTQRPSLIQDITKKIILLGDAGVGKTSLANRWLLGQFDPRVHPTIGASHTFREVNIDGQPLKITLWDTAGQEQFRSMTPLYARGAACAIVVAAALSTDSFDSIPYWLELVSSAQEPPIPAILAVNKFDLVDESDDKLTNLIELYKGHFTSLFCVSAITDLNVDCLFREAVLVAARPMGETTENHTISENEERRACC
jgi:small GTP-binding protein